MDEETDTKKHDLETEEPHQEEAHSQRGKTERPQAGNTRVGVVVAVVKKPTHTSRNEPPAAR